MRKYEVMLILSPDVDDSAVEAVTDRVGQIVGEGGGRIDRIDRWGKRRLAYDIDRRSEGHYVIVDCLAEPAAMRELDRVLSLADPVLRFKVLVRGEADQAKVAGNTGQDPATAAQAPAPEREVSVAAAAADGGDGASPPAQEAGEA